MDYEEMLKKAKEKLPEVEESSERFEVSKVRGHVEGNKTIISNFVQIANHIGRKPEHVLKCILKELAAPGEIKNQRLIIGTKVSSVKVNDSINNYVNTFVICKTCNRPDTKLSNENGVIKMTCQACGAKSPVNYK